MSTSQPLILSGLHALPQRPRPALERSSLAALAVSHWPDVLPDLNQPACFQRLLDCLCYALAIDESVDLAAALGMPVLFSNQDALAIWVSAELKGIQFLDGSALFNFLVRQLDNLIGDTGGGAIMIAVVKKPVDSRLALPVSVPKASRSDSITPSTPPSGRLS